MCLAADISMDDTRRGLTPEELANNEAADLPDREAMSLLSPGSVLGGGALGGPPLGDATTPPAPGGNLTPPPTMVDTHHLPVPEHQPGTYSPDTSASSKT
jgi:hypothetical protein